MSVTDVRNARLINRAVPEHDTVTLGEWRQRVALGPAPVPAPPPDRRPVCPHCGKRFIRKGAPVHTFCSLQCRLRWQAAQRKAALR